MTGMDTGQLTVQGRLNIETVPELFDKGLLYLSEGDLRVDFSQVKTVDSAAISMLLGWKRAAQRYKRSVQVIGWPADLLSLAKLYGVDGMLPLDED